MEELLYFIVTRIVTKPDEVSISREEENDSTVRFHITVHSDDAGLVIGKGGKVINSIRNLIKIQAIKQNKRVYLDLTNEKPLEAEQDSDTKETPVNED